MARTGLPATTPRRGLVVAKIAGIQITLDPSWVIGFVVLVLLAGDVWVDEIFPPTRGVLRIVLSALLVVPLMASILFHEFSHALVARAHGLRVRRITLFVFGGVAQIEDAAARPSAEFRVAIAGPLASLFLASTFALVSRLQHPGFIGLPGPWGTLAGLNLSLAVFNLLPLFPMDGGRILRSALWGGWANRARATRWAVAVGRTLAIGIVAAGFVMVGMTAIGARAGSAGDLWVLLIGLFLYNAAGTAGRAESGDEPHERAR